LGKVVANSTTLDNSRLLFWLQALMLALKFDKKRYSNVSHVNVWNMHTSTTRECGFSHTKRCGSWHVRDKLCGFIHFNVQYVVLYEVWLFVWEKPHSLVGLPPLPKHQKPTVVATDLHSSTIVTEEQRKVHLMDILNFNTTQSKLSTKLLGTWVWQSYKTNISPFPILF
jgi:hypothetical protein